MWIKKEFNTSKEIHLSSNTGRNKRKTNFFKKACTDHSVQWPLFKGGKNEKIVSEIKKKYQFPIKSVMS